MIPFSNHPLYRALWGWLGPPEVSLLKLAQGPVIRRASVYAHVVQASLPTAQAGRASSPADPPPVAANPPPLGGSQESIMPLWRLPEGIAKFDDWFGAYPLLVFPVTLCPALPARLPSLHACGSRPSRPPSRPSAPSTFSRAPPTRPHNLNRSWLLASRKLQKPAVVPTSGHAQRVRLGKEMPDTNV